jgi:hypothetical protein
MKLDLETSEPVAALVLAVVVADQAAQKLGIEDALTVKWIGADALSVSLGEGYERTWEVFAAGLRRRLGAGFAVDVGEGGALTVSLDLAEADDEAPEEAAEIAAAAPAKRPRGRPRKHPLPEARP